MRRELSRWSSLSWQPGRRRVELPIVPWLAPGSEHRSTPVALPRRRLPPAIADSDRNQIPCPAHASHAPAHAFFEQECSLTRGAVQEAGGKTAAVGVDNFRCRPGSFRTRGEAVKLT